MKNLKKVLAVLTAVSAMAASTSAFAANVATVSGNVAGTYEIPADGTAYKLNITGITPADGATIDESKDKTLLVLDEGALSDEVVADSEILYIDQGSAFTGLGLKDEIIGEETTTGYIIKVGYYDADGNFAIAEGTIAVAEPAEEVKTMKLVWGDTTLDGGVNFADAIAALNYIGGVVKTYADDESEYTVGNNFTDTLVWGDTTLDGGVNFADAIAALNYIGGVVKTYTDGEAEYTVGTEYTINLK